MIADIADRIDAGERLPAHDGLRLLRHFNLPELALLADHVRARKHPAPVVSYIIGRRLAYTNVCCVRHRLSEFYRPPGSPDGYALTSEAAVEHIQELVDAGGTDPGSCQLLLRGGLNPELQLDYFENLLGAIRGRFPSLVIHGLSPTAILYLARISRVPMADCSARLRSAGLDSIAASGPELLSRAVHDILDLPNPTAAWLDLHRAAHRAGLRSTATMVYGGGDPIESRVSHLDDIRDLQDETGGFSAFVLCHPTSAGSPAGAGHAITTGYDQLRQLAVCRLFLDNIDHFEASWDAQGQKIAQVSLQSGADDAGSVVPEQGGAAGWTGMRLGEIERLIRAAGREPMRRNARYERLN